MQSKLFSQNKLAGKTKTGKQFFFSFCPNLFQVFGQTNEMSLQNLIFDLLQALENVEKFNNKCPNHAKNVIVTLLH